MYFFLPRCDIPRDKLEIFESNFERPLPVHACAPMTPTFFKQMTRLGPNSLISCKIASKVVGLVTFPCQWFNFYPFSVAKGTILTLGLRSPGRTHPGRLSVFSVYLMRYGNMIQRPTCGRGEPSPGRTASEDVVSTTSAPDDVQDTPSTTSTT